MRVKSSHQGMARLPLDQEPKDLETALRLIARLRMENAELARENEKLKKLSGQTIAKKTMRNHIRGREQKARRRLSSERNAEADRSSGSVRIFKPKSQPAHGWRKERGPQPAEMDESVEVDPTVANSTELVVSCISSVDNLMATIEQTSIVMKSMEKLTIRPSQHGSKTERLYTDGAIALANLISRSAILQGIRTLDLFDNNIGCPGISALLPALEKCKQLENLHLGRNHIRDESGVQLVKFVAKHPRITLLSLPWNTITAKGAKLFIEILKASAHGVRHLDLIDNHVPPRLTQQLKRLLKVEGKGDEADDKVHTARPARMRQRKKETKKECPARVRNALTPLLEKASNHPLAAELRKPTGLILKAYMEAIPEPVFLDDVKTGIQSGRYTNEQEVIEALRRCILDALNFYKPSDSAYKSAVELAHVVETELAELPKAIRPHPIELNPIVRRVHMVLSKAKNVPKGLLDKVRRDPASNALVIFYAWRVLYALKEKNKVEALPFIDPVDPDRLNIPEYPAVIKTPLAMEDIRKRLVKGQYKSLDNFFGDVHRVFENAVSFNPRFSETYNKAIKCWQTVLDQWQRIPREARPLEIDNNLGQVCRRYFLYIRSKEPAFHFDKSLIKGLARRPYKLFSRLSEESSSPDSVLNRVVRFTPESKESGTASQLNSSHQYYLVVKVNILTLGCVLLPLTSSSFPQGSRLHGQKCWEIIEETAKEVTCDVKEISAVTAFKAEESDEKKERESWIIPEASEGEAFNYRPPRRQKEGKEASSSSAAKIDLNYWTPRRKSDLCLAAAEWQCFTCGLVNKKEISTCGRCWDTSPFLQKGVPTTSKGPANMSIKASMNPAKVTEKEDPKHNPEGKTRRSESIDSLNMELSDKTVEETLATPKPKKRKRGRPPKRQAIKPELPFRKKKRGRPKKHKVELKAGDLLRVTWTDEGTFDCVLDIADGKMVVSSVDNRFRGKIPFDIEEDAWEKIGRTKKSAPNRSKKGSRRGGSRAMTYEEKNYLFKQIHGLPRDKIEGVVAIIDSHKEKTLKRNGGSQPNIQEVEIDIDTLSTECLHSLKKYVNKHVPDELQPEVGMRVSVWFSNPPEWFQGTIQAMRRLDHKGPHAKRKRWSLTIKYDDGDTEDTQYPDPKGELMLKRH